MSFPAGGRVPGAGEGASADMPSAARPSVPCTSTRQTGGKLCEISSAATPEALHGNPGWYALQPSV